MDQELLAGRNQRRSSMNVPSLSLQLKCSATWDNCLLTLCLPALRQDLGMSFALLLQKRTEGKTCGCQERSTKDNSVLVPLGCTAADSKCQWGATSFKKGKKTNLFFMLMPPLCPFSILHIVMGSSQTYLSLESKSTATDKNRQAVLFRLLSNFFSWQRWYISLLFNLQGNINAELMGYG